MFSVFLFLFVLLMVLFLFLLFKQHNKNKVKKKKDLTAKTSVDLNRILDSLKKRFSLKHIIIWTVLSIVAYIITGIVSMIFVGMLFLIAVSFLDIKKSHIQKQAEEFDDITKMIQTLKSLIEAGQNLNNSIAQVFLHAPRRLRKICNECLLYLNSSESVALEKAMIHFSRSLKNYSSDIFSQAIIIAKDSGAKDLPHILNKLSKTSEKNSRLLKRIVVQNAGILNSSRILIYLGYLMMVLIPLIGTSILNTKEAYSSFNGGSIHFIIGLIILGACMFAYKQTKTNPFKHFPIGEEI